MKRFCVAVLVLGSSGLAESPADLLQRVADHYRNATSFEVKGTASALVPGTSWRVSYDFETEGAQPGFLPLSVRTASMRVISHVGGNLKETLAVEGATDPKPPTHFGIAPFGQYSYITRRLIDAQKIGTETITVQDHAYPCEVIDAVYDFSPSFKPHSVIRHKHLSVAPTDLLVLRETNSVNGLDWIADVTAFSFDRPPSEAMVKALQQIAAQPKDRPEWVGRPAPDLSLPQLSGAPVKFSELRGKPLLLDFWGSYCGPCRRTTLYAQDLQKRFGSSGLVVLTLTQDTSADAKLWIDYNHVTLPVLLDSDGAAFKAFEIQGVPVTIFIDENGKVGHYWVGLDDPSSMDSALRTALHSTSGAALSSQPNR
jgi:cytochrome c biogenesis protein CcmG, thiol:disulfide interchange protein DsbE